MRKGDIDEVEDVGEEDEFPPVVVVVLFLPFSSCRFRSAYLPGETKKRLER